MQDLTVRLPTGLPTLRQDPVRILCKTFETMRSFGLLFWWAVRIILQFIIPCNPIL